MRMGGGGREDDSYQYLCLGAPQPLPPALVHRHAHGLGEVHAFLDDLLLECLHFVAELQQV